MTMGFENNSYTVTPSCESPFEATRRQLAIMGIGKEELAEIRQHAGEVAEVASVETPTVQAIGDVAMQPAVDPFAIRLTR